MARILSGLNHLANLREPPLSSLLALGELTAYRAAGIAKAAIVTLGIALPPRLGP